MATYHDKIMIAKVKKLEEKILKNKIIDLCLSNIEMDNYQIVVKMKEIVPEFISNNSTFETLDIIKEESDKVKNLK